MSTLLISDLVPVKHGGAKLSVSSRKTARGHRGTVRIEFGRAGPKAYTLSSLVDRPTDVDATIDAIALRKAWIRDNVSFGNGYRLAEEQKTI